MLRTQKHAQNSLASSYVCHSCRYKLSLVHHRRRRWQSTEATPMSHGLEPNLGGVTDKIISDLGKNEWRSDRMGPAFHTNRSFAEERTSPAVDKGRTEKLQRSKRLGKYHRSDSILAAFNGSPKTVATGDDPDRLTTRATRPSHPNRPGKMLRFGGDTLHNTLLAYGARPLADMPPAEANLAETSRLPLDPTGRNERPSFQVRYCPSRSTYVRVGGGPVEDSATSDVLKPWGVRRRGTSFRRRRADETMTVPDTLYRIKELQLKKKEKASPSGRKRKTTDKGVSRRKLRRVISKTKGSAATDSPKQSKGSSSDNGKPALLPLENALDRTFIEPGQLNVSPLDVPQLPVPPLQYGLDRVLFNEGIHQLQDTRSRVYNFDPYLQTIMPVIEFDYKALKEYKTSSQDTALAALASKHGSKYIGSTSSMTSTLAHFHYLLSDLRPLNLGMLSRGFSDQLATFTKINLAPNAIFLRWKNGTYAIDADKEYDGANVLMMLGKSMEKLLTMPRSDFERYRKSDPRVVPHEEREAPESFQYTTMGDFLMRSQLDAYDHRLPGNGTFDLKTRAVVSVRMSTEDFEPMTGYEIYTLQGKFESYEREYYDMMRSTMLKYMLQVRMGRMDGIFVAYHNVERIFGFQYLPVTELDRALHGQVDPCLGDQEFKASLDLLNKALNKATEKFPEQSLRLHFETKQEDLGGVESSVMWIFAEPMAESDIDRIQDSNKSKIAEFERTMMGIEHDEAPDSSQAVVDTPSDNSGEKEAQESTSSATDADVSFIESISADKTTKPLFVASLIVKSKVNGAYTDRPTPLRPGDKWEIDYVLQEYGTNDALWARYEQLKARRKDTLVSERDDDDLEVVATGKAGKEGSGKEKKKSDGYIRFLQGMSAKGRELRVKLNRLDEGKVPIVVGRPTPTSDRDAVSDNDDKV